jgi:methylenetetrahydrofolate reductase (NADPH)
MTETYSTLHRRLVAGQPVVTGEIAPPRGTSREGLEKSVKRLKPYVDAVNLTDNQRGMARMSALGAGAVVHQEGLEPIVQLTCQHRNRIALQSDILTAVMLGVRNFTCMTGDHPRNGDHPDAKSVLDLNSFRLIKLLRTMRDEQRFDSGTPLKDRPKYFVGAVANPNLEKAGRVERKIEHGAELIQTQIVYDLQRFRDWMADVRAAGMHQQAHILAGVMITRTAKSLHFMKANLPGMRIPDEIFDRMERTDDPEHEGLHLAADLIKEVLSIEGIAGVHLMSIGWSGAIPRVVEEAGLLPRPDAPAEA